jgi:DNA-binding CsgD family transcriptional regulator
MPRATVKKVLRKTGLPAVGEVPWGSHFCVFYETKRDLLDILVPYFKAGLEHNELCVSYVGSHEFHSIEEAKRALAKRLPEIDELFRKGNIELIARDEWFGSNGNINVSRTVARFRRKLDYARARGFSGLRFHGSSAWLRVHLHAGGFVRYEQEVDSILANQPAIVACTFPLMLTGAEQILDAARTHHFAITVRDGVWNRVGITDIDGAQKEAWKGKLKELTFRQRETLQLIAEEQSTKQIAALLGISIKTVEAHRLQLMRRLKIDNVPGLVRLAVRTGLVSAEI